MFAEQAIFTSARTKRHQGYQIVAKSHSLLDSLSDVLAKWGPTHGSLQSDDVGTHSINYISIDHEWVAVSRTFYGGPEYSARGALQVVTQFLILRRSQLAGYDNNPVWLVRTAMLLGHLWLPGGIAGSSLLPIELPDYAPSLLLDSPPTRANTELVNRSLAVKRGERLALIGAEDPISTIEQIVLCTRSSERLEWSFTTGLLPSQHRQFRIHMLPRLDASMHNRLLHQGIRFIAATV